MPMHARRAPKSAEPPAAAAAPAAGPPPDVAESPGASLSPLALPPGVTAETLAVIVVDHGSRRPESNALLLEVAAAYQRSAGLAIVEPAHMELAEPSLRAAFARCVARGAKLVIVHPFFLLPGKHWDEDIPALAAAAAAEFPQVAHAVTAPLGLHPLLAQVMHDRVTECLRKLRGPPAAK